MSEEGSSYRSGRKEGKKERGGVEEGKRRSGGREEEGNGWKRKRRGDRGGERS